jgi:hypothetical protein
MSSLCLTPGGKYGATGISCHGCGGSRFCRSVVMHFAVLLGGDGILHLWMVTKYSEATLVSKTRKVTPSKFRTLVSF